jgi:general nucleoside transport system permease protein
MTTTLLDADAVAESPAVRGFWTRSRRAGAVYLVLGAVAAALFGSLAGAGTMARFTLSTRAAGAGFDLPARPAAIGFGVLCALVGAALLAGWGRRRFGAATGLAVLGFVMSFLCWSYATHDTGARFLPLVALAQATLYSASPLILGALSGVLCERAGVINVAIEGQFLMGAFCGALVGTLAASAWAGLVAAMVGGLFIAALLAVLAIRYLVDQVVVGVVLNVLALGVTGFLYDQLMQQDTQKYNQPVTFHAIAIPGLSRIPVLGPVLFDNSVLIYAMLVLVAVIYTGLFHTRWGLRVRAVGEHPTAADTVGIRVRLVRYRNVLLGGLVAGIGGAWFSLGAVPGFQQNMTNGKGFIALAALIFGRWNPLGAVAGALLFGFADALQTYLASINSPIPSQFLQMTPYLVTIVAVAGLVGRVRAPAADGKPYLKG